MNKELTIEQLELLLNAARDAQGKHPEANVVYDCEHRSLRIYYPLQKDFWDIKNMKLEIKNRK